MAQGDFAKAALADPVLCAYYGDLLRRREALMGAWARAWAERYVARPERRLNRDRRLQFRLHLRRSLFERPYAGKQPMGQALPLKPAPQSSHKPPLRGIAPARA